MSDQKPEKETEYKRPPGTQTKRDLQYKQKETCNTNKKRPAKETNTNTKRPAKQTYTYKRDQFKRKGN